MAKFIGTAALESIANKLAPQIIMGAARFRPDVFTRMKINIETGVQYQSTKTLMLRKGHTTQRKRVGDEVNNTAGIMVERKCVTSLAWNHFKDNRDNYRELAVVDTNDATKFSYPLSEIAMLACIANYGEDIFDCLWHGDSSIDIDDKENPKWYLHIMDGYITYLNKDIAAGYISKDFHNYVEVGVIDKPANTNDVSAYKEFERFREGWHQNLKNAPEVLVYCSEETGDAIAQAYSNANGNYRTVKYQDDDTYKFPQWRNITIVPESSFGTGDKMIATVPYNFDYCVDTQDERNGILVHEGSSRDALDIFFQPQSVQGVRVVNISPSSFCMSNGSLAPNDVAGDYTKDVFVVGVNDATLGSVTVNGSEPDNTIGYAANTSLELKATALSGAQFVMWSDGVTSATRTVVTKGQPGGVIAIFKKTA